MCSVIADKFSDYISIDNEDEVTKQDPNDGFKKTILTRKHKDETPDVVREDVTREDVIKQVQEIIDEKHSDNDVVV